MSIEAGGNAPFIVFDDADIDAAVAGMCVTSPSMYPFLIYHRRYRLQIPRLWADMCLREQDLRSHFNIRRLCFKIG